MLKRIVLLVLAAAAAAQYDGGGSDGCDLCSSSSGSSSMGGRSRPTSIRLRYTGGLEYRLDEQPARRTRIPGEKPPAPLAALAVPVLIGASMISSLLGP